MRVLNWHAHNLCVELFEIFAIQRTGPFPPGNSRLHHNDYALYGCRKRLLTWIIIVMVALAGVCCADTFGKYSGDVAIVPGIGCNETFSKAVYVVLILVLLLKCRYRAARIGLAYIAQFIFDSFIFILTM